MISPTTTQRCHFYCILSKIITYPINYLGEKKQEIQLTTMRSVEQGCESKTLENVIYMQIERSNNFQHLIS